MVKKFLKKNWKKIPQALLPVLAPLNTQPYGNLREIKETVKLMCSANTSAIPCLTTQDFSLLLIKH